MRILSVHNRYQIRGGEDESRESEERLLREMGHLVEVYEENNERIAELNPMRMAVNTVWSVEAYKTIRSRLREQPHDLVHVQNFFPLISPSIYYAAKAEKVPVVQTLRNYRLLCPNALFFRDGHVCEDCLGKFVPWPGILHACYRDRMATGVVTAMLTTHRMLRSWTEAVDIYIALTEFARQKFIQGGFPAEKIVVKPNFVHPDPGTGEGRGGYALFVGRLSPEKGISTLLEAWKQLGGKIPLKIVGDGPLALQVAEAAKQMLGVEWLERKPLEEVYELIGQAAFIVFPSEWYETFGRVAIEAFAKGTPVIAAAIGAIAELVEPERNGFHFRPGDPQDLAAKVELALSQPGKLAQMRQEARAEFEKKYTAKENYLRLMRIYAQTCSK
ncbi:MAG: glycosyltransferase [Gloeocapsa sp. UFS-A4-WI-NPMV-4B04]|nr:glycosyltransferase [Gloeocapsa sp. UFS-A4-WI-NPMV-4B04]